MVDLNPLKDVLLDRVPTRAGVGCLMCRLILEDLAKNGCLKGAILLSFDDPMFPPEAMILHLDLEGFGSLVPPAWRPPPKDGEK